MKKIVIPSALATLLLIVVVLFWLKSVPNRANTPDIPKADIVVLTPQPNEIIKSPLEVRGEARGMWFFEANLRVNLLDSEGTIIVATNGMAEGEWMTSDFVPFKAIVDFPTPKTLTGILRILNDNPSGLPENEKSFNVPVKFSKTISETASVKMFFSNSKFPNGVDCNETYELTRIIPKTQAVAEAAINQLILGVTDSEKQKGYFTSIPQGVKLQKITLDKGILKVDFSEELDKTGGSCRVTAIRSQIIQTGKQFPTVKDVIISINGRTEDILQP